MVHSFLKKLKKDDYVDCVYHIVFKFSHPEVVLQASNGNKYIKLAIEDSSLKANDPRATLIVYFNDESEVDFLKENSSNRTSYVKVRGKCFKAFPERIILNASKITPVNEESGIIFDTSNLYSYNEQFRLQFLSEEGKQNIPLRNTSSEKFQQDFDLVEVGAHLAYKRVHGSPHDKYQVNVYVPNIEETFNIPAYITPTMGKMIDEGYDFSILVTRVPGRDEEKGLNAGIRVTIKAKKNG